MKTRHSQHQSAGAGRAVSAFSAWSIISDRKRRNERVVVAALTCLSLMACGSGGGSGDNSQNLEPDTTPLFTVSVSDLGPVENNCDIMMRDGGYSAVINSRSIWVYGDTLLAYPNEDDNRLLSNSKSSTLDADACDGLFGFDEDVDGVGAPVQFIPFTEEEVAFNEARRGEHCGEEPCNARWAIWPGSIIVDDSKALVYFFYGKFYAEQGEFNFQRKGRSIAVWNLREESGPRRITFNEVEDFPTLLFSSDEPHFGSAAVRVNDMVYVYGCSLDKATMTKPCHLARVHIDNILEKGAWTYYRADGTWSGKLEEASPVMQGNTMMSVFYNTYLQSYVAIYTEPLENHIMLRLANRPEGPWSPPRKVWTAPAPQPSGWIYDALAHPEYSALDGRLIYVTHSLQTGEFNSEIRLLQLELSLKQEQGGDAKTLQGCLTQPGAGCPR